MAELDIRMKVWLVAWTASISKPAAEMAETAAARANECLKAFDAQFEEGSSVQGKYQRNVEEETKTRVLDLIDEYGGIDGGHHKQWLIDQILRLLAPDYGQWVKVHESGEDGENTFEWDTGIAP